MSKYLNISLLLLCAFAYIQASSGESYREYFKRQEEIYKEMEEKKIPGARPLTIDEDLAEKAVANSPDKVNDLVSDIQKNIFCSNKKNALLHGAPGTGKSLLAQAVAIKTKTPCLFFNAGEISTQYMNSGVQNFAKIFKYAKELEKRLGKPCVIIFDELESLTRKHTAKDNHENNVLISFWQGLDKLAGSGVVVIGTMNGTDDLPPQMIDRTSMIEVPLPDTKQRDAILSYYFKAIQNKHGIGYSEYVTPAILAAQTKGFSNRDLQNLMEQATKQVIKAPAVETWDPKIGCYACGNKVVMGYEFTSVIREIKKEHRTKLLGNFKKHLKSPTTFKVAGLGIASVGVLTAIESVKIARYTSSDGYRKDQVYMNASFFGIPYGLLIHYIREQMGWTTKQPETEIQKVKRKAEKIKRSINPFK
jgi:SpoVK/Ycf46/Vps4 family AAA+-type ATPase